MDYQAPLNPREPSRTACDRIDLYDTVETGYVRRYTLSGDRKKDHISVSRDELAGTDSGARREVHNDLVFMCVSAEVGRNSRDGPIYRKYPEVAVCRSPVLATNPGT